MSQYRKDDYDITPDWNDLNLDWLDDFDIGSPASGYSYEPRQTHFEPEQSLRSAQPRQIPTEPYQKPIPPRPAPTAARPEPEFTKDDIEDILASSWEEPTPTRRQPTPTRREPASTPREPAAARREPTPTRRQPTSTRREPPQSNRQAKPTGRRAAPSRRPQQPEPATRRPQPEPSHRQAKPSRRSARSVEVSPWDREQADPNYRQKGRRRKTNAPLLILIVVLVLGMCVAGWQLGSIFLNYRRDRSAYNDLASHAISGLAEFDTAGDEQSENPVNPNSATVSEIPIAVDWDYLRSINANVVGWLYCPGTVISYPVVQTSDHDYYLNHGFDGASNTAGTLFADRNSVSGIAQSNYIIYGHNMKDNSMFGTFANYVDKSYYDSNPRLYYLTPDGNYRVELLCAHICESTADNYPTYFSNASDYQNYLNKITASAFWVNYDILSTDYQLMSMSTCTYTSGYEDPRLLVHGMMIPLGQTE